MTNLLLITSLLQKIRKFGVFIPFSNICLNYGQGFLPRRMLVSLANKRNKKIQIVINRQLQYSVVHTEENSVSVNAPIWVCWMQGEENMPLIPKLCLQSIRKFANGHPVHLITSENMQSFVDVPDYIWNLYREHKIKPAHFADVYRVSLLAKHGGLWLDATMFLTENIDEAFLSSSFYTIKTRPDYRFVSQCKWAVFCLAGKANNSLYVNVRDMFYKYLSTTSVFVDYFLFDHFIHFLYGHDVSIRKIIENVPFNNPCVHELSPLLGENFNTMRFNELTKETTMFKLSWKDFPEQVLLGNTHNYYHHLQTLLR